MVQLECSSSGRITLNFHGSPSGFEGLDMGDSMNEAYGAE